MSTQRFVSSGKPATLSISQPLAWSLSAILLSFALFAPVAHYLSRYHDLESYIDKEVYDTFPLSSWRDPAKNGEFFMKRRYEEMPIQYGLLHVIPAIVWSINIPILLSDSFRARYPTAHRSIGYVTASLYVALMVSGIGFTFRHVWEKKPLSYSHINPLHIHKLRIKGVTVFAWGTFDAALQFVFVLQAYTLYRAIAAARAHRYAEHRTWAIVTAMAGYMIAFFRVGMIGQVVVAAIHYYLLPVSLLKSWGWEIAPGNETWDAELAGFALCTWFALACMAVWWRLNNQVAVLNQKTMTNASWEKAMKK